jgi:AraC family transcriptional regulator
MSRVLRFRAADYAPHLRQSAHAHDHLQISLVLRGTLEESTLGRVATARALSVGVKDAGVVHADRFGSDRVGIAQLWLPSGILRELLDDRPYDAWHWSHRTDAARPFLHLVTRAANGAQSFAADDTDVVDLLAALTARPATASRGEPPQWLVDVVDELSSTWQRGTQVRDVAQRAGVHPVYLARCFRRWYGHGVSDVLRFLRQRAAAHAVATHRRSISAIAHETGYADESHFTRDFRSLSGTTPAQWRRALARLTFRDIRAP